MKEIAGTSTEFSPQGNCIKCGEEMKHISLSDWAGVDHIPGWYCINEACQAYGLITRAIKKVSITRE